jgi:hypothetical protein
MQTAAASNTIDAALASVSDGSIDHANDPRAKASVAANAVVNPAGIGRWRRCTDTSAGTAARARTPNIANFNG